MPGKRKKKIRPGGAITTIHFVPKFCSRCGGKLDTKFIPEEKQERLHCAACGFIAYLNPPVVAGAIPETRGKILLLRRGIEPALHAWTFPAGFVELGESVAEAAVRETREETGVEIQVGKIIGVYSYSDAGVVTVVYRAKVVGGAQKITREAEEIAEFTKKTIPWKELAFRSTGEALKDWTRLK